VPEKSAASRDQLLRELTRLGSRHCGLGAARTRREKHPYNRGFRSGGGYIRGEIGRPPFLCGFAFGRPARELIVVSQSIQQATASLASSASV
jgi:hypothetical protein